MSSTAHSFNGPLPALSGVKLVAVGGCGLSTLDQMNSYAVHKFGTVAFDTDSARLAESDSDSRLLLGQALTEGYGTGGDEALGARVLAGMHLEVRDLLSDGRVNILIGGLGGGTATALLPELAKISRSLGILTLVVATRPFKYEGQNKTVTAKRRMHSLVRSADSVFMINNNAVLGDSAKVSAAEAVKRSDAALQDTITGLLEFLQPTKRMLLDFGTIKGQLTRGGLSAFASGVSAMRNNAIEALKAALNKFAKARCDITKAPRALVQFSIDDDVMMDGVKNAFGVAQRVFSKDAQLAMGVVFNGVKQGKTKVSVIATGLPLFNEVVELDISETFYPEYENPSRNLPRSRKGTANFRRLSKSDTPFTGVPETLTGHWGGRESSLDKENVKILNPRLLSDEELKIPAYLRRRMMKETD